VRRRHALIVDNGSRSTTVVDRLVGQAGWSTSVVPHTRLAARPGEYDAVILTGTDLPVFASGYEDEIALVRAAAVPVLGICGGMQLIGRAYGVGLEKGEPVLGRSTVRLRPGVDLFRELPRDVMLFQRHIYRLTAAPYGFEVIASSSGCPVESVRHRTRPLYGMQAHVEFRPHGQQILRRFLDLAANHQPEPRKAQR
jgi:GMP synthase-like glutamine amidotransferase